jgi:hypothetical protein
MAKKNKATNSNTQKYVIKYKDETTAIIEGSFAEAWNFARKTAKTFSIESA